MARALTTEAAGVNSSNSKSLNPCDGKLMTPPIRKVPVEVRVIVWPDELPAFEMATPWRSTPVELTVAKRTPPTPSSFPVMWILPVVGSSIIDLVVVSMLGVPIS